MASDQAYAASLTAQKYRQTCVDATKAARNSAGEAEVRRELAQRAWMHQREVRISAKATEEHFYNQVQAAIKASRQAEEELMKEAEELMTAKEALQISDATPSAEASAMTSIPKPIQYHQVQKHRHKHRRIHSKSVRNIPACVPEEGVSFFPILAGSVHSLGQSALCIH